MFNHYVKLKRIIEANPNYRIILIDEPTTTKNYNGETLYYDYYYRLVDPEGNHLKYGKFQQLDKLASTLNLDVSELEKRIIKE